jgi:phosphate transport system permease protein
VLLVLALFLIARLIGGRGPQLSDQQRGRRASARDLRAHRGCRCAHAACAAHGIRFARTHPFERGEPVVIARARWYRFAAATVAAPR